MPKCSLLNLTYFPDHFKICIYIRNFFELFQFFLVIFGLHKIFIFSLIFFENKLIFLNKGNIELYSKYKFVIAIENSNCEDYVTEKLVHAVASGSIPIVAGRDNKPDYLKFMPRNSFINIYDFKTVEELATHLKMDERNDLKTNKCMRFFIHPENQIS